MSFKFKVEGADEAIAKLKSLSVETKSKVINQTAKSSLKIEAESKNKAPVDTGRLRSSIQTRFEDEGLIGIIYSDVAYAPYVEFGRKAGKPPPSSALKGWARRHKMEGLSYVIARSIGRKGVKAQPFLRPSFEKEKNDYKNKVKRILKEMEG